MATLTVQPDADPETSSFDAYYHNSLVDWAEYLGDTGWGGGIDTGLTNDIGVRVNTSDTGWYYGRLSVIGFDISAIPAGSVITKVELKLYCSAKVLTISGIGAGDDDVVIQQASPTYNNQSSSGDIPFGNLVARFAETNFTANAWTTLDLGSNGVNYVQSKLGGSVFFGLDVGIRYDNKAEPTHNADERLQYSFHSAEHSSGNKPQLIITYTPPAGGQVRVIFI